LPGSEGEGVADVLFRAADGSVPFDFGGRLSFSWPASAQAVLFDDTGAAHGALFPVGYGLDYAKPHELAAVSEEARLTPAQRVSNTLFHAAHVTAPWSIFLADELAAVRLTTPQQTSPAGSLLVQQSAEGLNAQWSAGHRALLEVFGRAADLRSPAREGLSLVLRYRVLQPPSEAVRLGVLCESPYVRHPPEPDATTAEADRQAVRCGTGSGAFIDVTAAVKGATAPGWHQLILPLRCLAQAGADLSNVDTPLALSTTGSLALAIQELRLERTPVQGCAGEKAH